MAKQKKTREDRVRNLGVGRYIKQKSRRNKINISYEKEFVRKMDEQEREWRAKVRKTYGAPNYSSVTMELEVPFEDIDDATNYIDSWCMRELENFPEELKKKEKPTQSYSKPYPQKKSYPPKKSYNKPSGQGRYNGSEDGNAWAKNRGFGTGKQWDTLLKFNVDPDLVQDEDELQDAFKNNEKYQRN